MLNENQNGADSYVVGEFLSHGKATINSRFFPEVPSDTASDLINFLASVKATNRSDEKQYLVDTLVPVLKRLGFLDALTRVAEPSFHDVYLAAVRVAFPYTKIDEAALRNVEEDDAAFYALARTLVFQEVAILGNSQRSHNSNRLFDPNKTLYTNYDRGLGLQGILQMVALGYDINDLHARCDDHLLAMVFGLNQGRFVKTLLACGLDPWRRLDRSKPLVEGLFEDYRDSFRIGLGSPDGASSILASLKELKSFGVERDAVGITSAFLLSIDCAHNGKEEIIRAWEQWLKAVNAPPLVAKVAVKMHKDEFESIRYLPILEQMGADMCIGNSSDRSAMWQKIVLGRYKTNQADTCALLGSVATTSVQKDGADFEAALELALREGQVKVCQKLSSINSDWVNDPEIVSRLDKSARWRSGTENWFSTFIRTKEKQALKATTKVQRQRPVAKRSARV